MSGIHVSVVAALREYYGLDRHPVKVNEPYQMLGEVEDDLKQAMGIDTEGVLARKTIFGFPNEGWKSWRTYQGQDVLVPRDFNVTIDEKGDTLIYPEGDTSAPASGRMPQRRVLLRRHRAAGAGRRREAERRGQPGGVLARRRTRTSSTTRRSRPAPERQADT